MEHDDSGDGCDGNGRTACDGTTGAAGCCRNGVTRNPERAETIFSVGVVIAVGDLMWPETLREALQGVEVMFLVVPSDEPQANLNTDPRGVTFANEVGVKWVVVLVSFEEGPVEEAVRRSGKK